MLPYDLWVTRHSVVEVRSAHQHALCFSHRPVWYRPLRSTMDTLSKTCTGIPGKNGHQNTQDTGRFILKCDPEEQSENSDEEDGLLDANSSPPSDVWQQGVRFQPQRHQHWKKTGVFAVDGISNQHHIKPLVKSPQLQSHHRLSHNSLLSTCKNMDFCYEDERYHILKIQLETSFNYCLPKEFLLRVCIQSNLNKDSCIHVLP